MYRKIAKMPSVLDLYRKKLADENIISADEANEVIPRLSRFPVPSCNRPVDLKQSYCSNRIGIRGLP